MIDNSFSSSAAIYDRQGLTVPTQSKIKPDYDAQGFVEAKAANVVKVEVKPKLPSRLKYLFSALQKECDDSTLTFTVMLLAAVTGLTGIVMGSIALCVFYPAVGLPVVGLIPITAVGYIIRNVWKRAGELANGRW